MLKNDLLYRVFKVKKKSCLLSNAKVQKLMFFITIGIVAILVAFLTYQQCMAVETGIRRYHSDTGLHLDIARLQIERNETRSAYSFLHVIMNGFLQVTNMSWQGASVLTACILASCIVATILLVCLWYTCLYKMKPNAKIYFLSLTSVFVSMIILRYGQTISPNVWHNPTLILSRPFSIVVILCVYLVWKNHNEGKSVTKYLWINSIFAVLSVWAKPSFLSTFLPTLCVFLFIELFCTKGKSFLISFKLGVSFVPILFVLGCQYYLLYMQKSEDNAIAIGGGAPVGIWLLLRGMLTSSAFFLAGWIILLLYKKTSKEFLAFSGLWYAISMWVRYALRETGSRTNDGNFTWGYIIMLFCVFVFVSGELFIKPTPTSGRKIPKPVMFGIAGLYGLHLIYGLYYFVRMLNGVSYEAGGTIFLNI